MRHCGVGEDNLLFELAQALAAGGERDAAIALRMLARAGYTSLEQARCTSDWVLMAIPGLGLRRLAHVRRLTGQHWHPPLRPAAEAMHWFLNAARFALRFWCPETLAATILGSVPKAAAQASAEERWALEMFAVAAASALRHCQVDELARILLQMGDDGPACRGTDANTEGNRDLQVTAAAASTAPVSEPRTGRETDHFAFPRDERFEIVRQYHEARRKGEVANKDQWAFANHNISGRTLSRYEREYLAFRGDGG